MKERCTRVESTAYGFLEPPQYTVDNLVCSKLWMPFALGFEVDAQLSRANHVRKAYKPRVVLDEHSGGGTVRVVVSEHEVDHFCLTHRKATFSVVKFRSVKMYANCGPLQPTGFCTVGFKDVPGLRLEDTETRDGIGDRIPVRRAGHFLVMTSSSRLPTLLFLGRHSGRRSADSGRAHGPRMRRGRCGSTACNGG